MRVTEGHRPFGAEYKYGFPVHGSTGAGYKEASRTTLDKETGLGGWAGVAQSATLDGDQDGHRLMVDLTRFLGLGVARVKHLLQKNSEHMTA